jgi:hypothetical protein
LRFGYLDTFSDVIFTDDQQSTILTLHFIHPESRNSQKGIDMEHLRSHLKHGQHREKYRKDQPISDAGKVQTNEHKDIDQEIAGEKLIPLFEILTSDFIDLVS